MIRGVIGLASALVDDDSFPAAILPSLSFSKTNTVMGRMGLGSVVRLPESGIGIVDHSRAELLVGGVDVGLGGPRTGRRAEFVISHLRATNQDWPKQSGSSSRSVMPIRAGE